MKRRALFSSAVALAIMPLAGAPLAGSALAAQDGTPPAGGARPDGGWSFTDDRGRVIELDAMPERVVADAAAGAALLELGIVPAGLFGFPGLLDLPAALDDVPFLDITSGALDIEALLTLAPDLLVGLLWDDTDPTYFGQLNEAEIPGLATLAPTVGILAVNTPLDRSLSRFEDLALALGADLAAPSLVANHEAFDAAAARVREAAAAKPGLKVMAFSPYSDGLWIGNPGPTADLAFFAGLGVDIYVPAVDDPASANNVFQPLSWEVIGTIPIDLYLRDDRSDTLTAGQLLEHPVFSRLPAAQAGQIGTWTVQYVPAYPAVTRILDDLATSIEAAEVVT